MKYKFLSVRLSLLLVAIMIVNCSNDDNGSYSPSALFEEGEELLTGPLGVNSTSNLAFGTEINGLSIAQLGQFATGNSLFTRIWVSAPASTTARDGLGPTFNARSCTKCHFRDGRGSPPENGISSNGFLMRISLPGQSENGGANPVPNYGEQIQDIANFGIPFEARVNVNYTPISGTYADGTTYELRKPEYSFIQTQFGSLDGVLTSPRIGTQTIGLGLINALPDSELLKHADEFDVDGDGISGRPNRVWNIRENRTTLGRFGWKANAPTLEQQVAAAFHGDMGLTSSLFPENNCPSPQLDCQNAFNGGTPEVTDIQLRDVLLYQATLAVPNRRNFREDNVLLGKQLFNDLNCIGCHAINLQTGTSSITPVLNNINIRPYSDFLLHDMGEGLADNRPDFLATGREWRTQPLWGIGLIEAVNNHTFFLHDGRARSVEEAILWHGGEAENSKNAFTNLNLEQRNNLIAFINSL